MNRTRSLIAGAAVVALAAAAAFVTLGGSGTAITEEAAAEPANPNASLVATSGQFMASCPYTHSLPDDPIVHRNMAAMSHVHDFFGNASTNARSTYSSLLAAKSSCDDVGDRSAYWTPALFVNGARALPERVDAYYRVGSGVDPKAVVPFPRGLKALAGEQGSTRAQSPSVVAWTCGLSPKLHSVPPSGCGTDNPVNLRLTFPDCWNGRSLDSSDHRSHLAYSTTAGCPSGHRVPIPQLTLVVHYPVSGAVTSSYLASGPITGAHGDFFVAWRQQRIEAQVHGCLNRSVTCGILGGTFHTGPGSRDLNSYNHPESVR
ncbi:MAG: DUF1996 domain-containing protein [Microthrixaceae bacterium]